jgi:hypothetical protein
MSCMTSLYQPRRGVASVGGQVARAVARSSPRLRFDFSHERCQDRRDMLGVIRAATRRAGSTASENNGGGIMTPRGRVPFRRRRLGDGHG